MRKVQYTIEELTCPECGFVAVNANGLRGHRQFKHGVRSSGAQLPLQKQDLLVSESRLTQLLDERFATVSEQLDALSGEQPGALSGEQLEQLQQQVKDLAERVAAAEGMTIDDFSPREKAEFVVPWLAGLDDKDFFTLARNTGHDVVPDPAVVNVLAETFRRQAEEARAEEEPKFIEGKTTKPGYKYLDHINISVRG